MVWLSRENKNKREDFLERIIIIFIMRKNIMVKKLWKGLLTVEFLIYACKIRENFYEETFQKKKKL